jgi:hypothetical protein
MELDWPDGLDYTETNKQTTIRKTLVVEETKQTMLNERHG